MKLPPLPRVASIPRDNLDNTARYGTAVVRQITRTLTARGESSTCKPGNTSSVCARPTDSTNTQTLPIVLGAVIPITCAIIVFYFLHRRNKKKQALEDSNDPHKSLDFGLDIGQGPGPKKNKKRSAPEMIITDMSDDPMSQARKARGMSMDMLGSPYLLPAGLQASETESLHSMSRALPDENDPYRPVTFMRTSEDTSRSQRHFKENGSMYSASTNQTAMNDKSSLMQNAQRMSQSYPKRGDSKSEDDALSRQTTNTSNLSIPTNRKESLSSSNNKSLPDIAETRKDPAPRFPKTPEISVEEISFPAPPEPAVIEGRPPPRSSSRPPRKSSAAKAPAPLDLRHMSNASEYDDVPPPPPRKDGTTPEPEFAEYDVDPSMIYTGRFSIDTPAPSQQYPVQNNRMSVMGLRPLPPDDLAESAEQRANRIRSFYKEYFDVNRPNPANGHYEEDWDAGYMDGAAMYDPETGEYYMTGPPAPFAQPIGRRAMTPPPRGAGGPPRFGGDHARHFSTMSGGPGPQAQVRGRPAQRAPPKKKLPPPKALMSLPTPHMLKNDDAAIFGAVDFAPPTSFREMQNGRRPDSPMGIQRPFSPGVKAYSPLVPAFDELSVMPSPHHLRKSGTFTSLDFAQLPRFRGQEATASDAGSIRSARSGISAMQMDAVRSGAYRVSRIPKEFVTSREDLQSQLRPKMDLISRA